MVIRMAYEQAVSVEKVTKRYGGAPALDGVSFQVAPGTVAALLGPNGAGKTTMIRILSTLLRPDAGSARVAGYDVRRDREKVQALIGLTGQSLSVDGRLSGQENLAMFGRLHRLQWPAVRKRSAALLEVFDLAGAGKRAVKTYSGGMRRKLDLAISLLAEPRILFLDEPTTGLDPASRHALWDIIRGLVAQGTTVLLTTQYLDEADALATDVVFIASGQVVATGTPAELKARAGQAQLELTAASDAGFALLASAVASFSDVHGDAGQRTVRVAVRDLAEVSAITAAAAQAGADVTRFALHEPDLDDVYFQLTIPEEAAA
jgi:daunorubicin resistance ABC transporter ATP-binding subunit